MHQADIKIHQDGTDITDAHMPMLTKLSAMGGGIQIPPKVLYPLHQLGITNHTQLVCQKGTHIISCLDLQNLHGTTVKDCHIRALIRVSLLISGHMPDGFTQTGPAHTHQNLSHQAPHSWPLPQKNHS